MIMPFTLSYEWNKQLSPKRSWERFVAGEAQASRILVIGDMGGFEEPIPYGEGEGEVFVDGACVGVVVVPYVHFRAVDDVAEGSDLDSQV